MVDRRLHSATEGETLAAGELLGRQLTERFPQGVVVLLVGPLGAGKTVMARGIARGVGVREPVISPTYTIIADYRLSTGSFHHVDLYRIEGQEQLDNLGLEDIIRGGGIVLIEWGEKLAQAPGLRAALGSHVRVSISLARDGGRDLSIEEVPG